MRRVASGDEGEKHEGNRCPSASDRRGAWRVVVGGCASWHQVPFVSWLHVQVHVHMHVHVHVHVHAFRWAKGMVVPGPWA